MTWNVASFVLLRLTILMHTTTLTFVWFIDRTRIRIPVFCNENFPHYNFYIIFLSWSGPNLPDTICMTTQVAYNASDGHLLFIYFLFVLFLVDFLLSVGRL